MKCWVVDASVAVKWFFHDEELQPQATSLLEDLVNDPNSFVVPDLFYVEVAAVTTRKSGSNDKMSISVLQRLWDLGIPTLSTSGTLLLRSISLSCSKALTVYDTIYIALAESARGTWVTSDKRALKTLKQNVLYLGDYPVRG